MSLPADDRRPRSPRPALLESLERRQFLCAWDGIGHAAAWAARVSTATAEGGATATLEHGDGTALPVDDVVTAPLTWSTKASMPQRREEGANAVINGRLYVFGGFYDHTFNGTGRVDAYNPATNTWQQRASMPEAITHAASLTINGEAWLFGGYVGKDPGPATKKVYIYNPNTNAWRRGPDMPMSRGAAAAAQVGSNVYVFGGRNLDRSYDIPQTFALNLTTNTWSTKANLPNPRNHIAGAAHDGRVYAIGGQHFEASSAVNQRSVHRYDPANNTWTSVASLPFAVSHNVASTFTYNGRIIVVGGETAHNVASGKVLVYEPWRNAWRSPGSLPEARRAPQAGIINGKLYVAGGSIRGGQRGDLWVSNSLDSVL